jgi:hypothetical protein
LKLARESTEIAGAKEFEKSLKGFENREALKRAGNEFVKPLKKFCLEDRVIKN